MFVARELCDRAFRFLSGRETASEDELLQHVYGGAAPIGLHRRFLEPLEADPRLIRRADGRWSVRHAERVDPGARAVTTLALAATGPSPSRARIVRICALHFEG